MRWNLVEKKFDLKTVFSEYPFPLAGEWNKRQSIVRQHKLARKVRGIFWTTLTPTLSRQREREKLLISAVMGKGIIRIRFHGQL